MKGFSHQQPCKMRIYPSTTMQNEDLTIKNNEKHEI